MIKPNARILTGVDAEKANDEYPISASLRQKLVYFDNGILWVSDSYKRDREVLAFVDLISRDFKKRFKKVTALVRGKQVSNVVKFKFKGNLWISMTENHPVLINSNGKLVWKEAGKITTNDSVHVLANTCARCGKPTPYFKKYCSHTCLSKDITEKQRSSEEHRQKVSTKNRLSMYQQYENGERIGKEITKKANEKTRQLLSKSGEARHRWRKFLL